MAIEVDRGLTAAWRTNSAACRLRLDQVPIDDGRLALAAAREALFQVPHPEEPSEPLPSHVGSPVAVEAGAEMCFDIADAEAYDGLIERVIAAVLEGIVDAGVSTGRLSAPPEVDQLDDDTAARVLANIRADGLPVGWYADLPIPPSVTRNSSTSTRQGWQVELRTTNLTAEELIAFYERELARVGYAVEASIEVRDQTWRYTASAFFTRGARSGRVQVTDYGGQTGIKIVGYPSGSARDTDWRLNLDAASPLPEGFTWRIARGEAETHNP